jgi:dihydrofolate reductase
VVLSLDLNYQPSGVTLFHDFDKAISYVRTLGLEKAFITGGATIYRLALKVADRLELTRIHHDYPGDVRFPDFDPNEWELVTAEDHDGLDTIGKQTVRFTYESYRRRISIK